MQKVFVSYSSDDVLHVEEIDRSLQENGITLWRDQHSLYGGQQWPKTIGEAIATSDFFLLIWSKYASESHFVEFEWTTAIALRKTIIPCLLDDTHLPPSLRGVHSITVKGLHEDIPRLLTALQTPLPDQASMQHSIDVIDKLQKIMITDPKQVVSQAKAIFNQERWNVQGDVYQAEGDIFLNIQQVPEQQKAKSKIDTWVKIVGLIVAILTVFISIFTLSEKVKDFIHLGPPTTVLRGVVLDMGGEPIIDAIVKVQEVPGETTTTTRDGGFYFPKVPGNVGDRVRVYVTKTGYQKHNEYVALPGPVAISLEK